MSILENQFDGVIANRCDLSQNDDLLVVYQHRIFSTTPRNFY